MLLVCPSCRTRYVVPDAAIGAAGRQVRCASCRHSWFQEGPASVAPPKIEPVVAQPVESAPISAPASSDALAPRPAADAPPPPPPMIDPEVRSEAKVGVAVPPPAADAITERSQFAHEPPFRPRRNPAKIMTYAAIAFAALVMVGGGALVYSGALQGSFTMSAAEPDLDILLHDNLVLGKANDGSPYFIASGSITNNTSKSQRIPDMLVTLKDASGRSVFNWTMKPPARTLAPGGKVDFSELKRDVPPASAKISVGWAL
jgi:predicted Zn finger-like uncharacterized protein